MTEIKIDLTWSDIWLLQSIALASRAQPAGLKDILAGGDYLNHAIFVFAEIQNGLARLTAAGCVECDRKKKSFRLSKSFRGEYDRITQRCKSPYLQREALEAYFHVMPWTPGSDPNRSDPRWVFPLITPEDYEKSIQAYHRMFAKAIRKSRRSRR